jgi:hypothetical protein
MFLPVVRLRSCRILSENPALRQAFLWATQGYLSKVSRLEHRADVRLSTVKRYVEALGGELEVFAAFGDRQVRLRAVDKGRGGNYSID